MRQVIESDRGQKIKINGTNYYNFISSDEKPRYLLQRIIITLCTGKSLSTPRTRTFFAMTKGESFCLRVRINQRDRYAWCAWWCTWLSKKTLSATTIIYCYYESRYMKPPRWPNRIAWFYARFVYSTFLSIKRLRRNWFNFFFSKLKIFVNIFLFVFSSPTPPTW